jgi:hypothetical protein
VRDPHVQAMHYKVISGGGISYLNPELMSFSTHLGTFDVSGDKLRIVLSEPIGEGTCQLSTKWQPDPCRSE